MDAYDPNELQEITSFDTVSNFSRANCFIGARLLDGVLAYAKTNCYAIWNRPARFYSRH